MLHNIINRIKALMASLRRNDGFTMVELMIVVTIIAILTGSGVYMYRNAIQKAKVQSARTEISQLSILLEQEQPYPATDEGLRRLVESGAIRPEKLKDPWGNPYQYRCPGEHDAFDLWSFGADGKEGGEGNNKDLTNWDLGGSPSPK